MKQNAIIVELFTIPQAACDLDKAKWTQAGEMIKKQLESKFGENIIFTHIEFMSEKWFANPKANNILGNGDINFPFVLVNGEITSGEKKINVSKVIRAIQQKLQA